MAVNNVKLRTPTSPLFTIQWIVAAGGANTIHSGEPTIKGEATGTSTGVVLPLADGDPLPTSGDQFAGLAKDESTDTASAAGVVTAYFPLPGLIYSAKAKTSTTADTAAEVNALKDKRVVFDLTATVYTVDAAATDAQTNALVIVGGDFRTTEIFFMITQQGTFMANIAGT